MTPLEKEMIVGMVKDIAGKTTQTTLKGGRRHDYEGN
jgi:hypothetical protein